MKRHATVALATLVLAGACSAVWAAEPAPSKPRYIDLAICLDTSNSMDGLIGSAKQKLWAVVNELATARPRPVLRVALYQYGNNGLESSDGWVQQVCPLTDDLDTVYGKLFGLKTHGGTEYVARVVRDATRELKWRKEKNALRILFVAGNEPATQDPKHKLEQTCSAAASRGIIINTIFCGAEQTGRRTGWADAARWADGRYASIDQDRGTVAVKTPYDKKLAELGAKLNTTYVAYGRAGREGRANQVLQDRNAVSAGAPAAAQRAVAKAGGLYRNPRWDLVDAVKNKQVKLDTVEAEALPEPMRTMDAGQRAKYVAEKSAERAKVQAEIRKLNAQRQEYVKKEMTREGLSEGKAFDAVLRAAVRAQAEARNFKFTPPPAPKPE